MPCMQFNYKKESDNSTKHLGRAVKATICIVIDSQKKELKTKQKNQTTNHKPGSWVRIPQMLRFFTIYPFLNKLLFHWDILAIWTNN